MKTQITSKNLTAETIKAGFKNSNGMIFSNSPEVRAVIAHEAHEILKKLHASKK